MVGYSRCRPRSRLVGELGSIHGLGWPSCYTPWYWTRTRKHLARASNLESKLIPLHPCHWLDLDDLVPSFLNNMPGALKPTSEIHMIIPRKSNMVRVLSFNPVTDHVKGNPIRGVDPETTNITEIDR